VIMVPTIRVLFSSRTIGGSKGRAGLAPVCHSCDKKIGRDRDIELQEAIPEETAPLVFLAQLAAQELEVELELIDISQLTPIQRIKELINGKPVPRVDIGLEFLTGLPTKQQIIELYNKIIRA